MENSKLARKIRRSILSTSYKAEACHIGSALSCVEILISLYYDIMKEKDIFIFSKASGVATLYSILAEKGYFAEKELVGYLRNYPLPSTEIPGVEVSAGSLGMILSNAVGRALGKKLKGEEGRVFCLVSDGELNSGNLWEAVMFAAHHELGNLTIIIDYNQHQACGRTHEVLKLEPLEKKFSAFNWAVGRINGHDFGKLKLIKHISATLKKPTCIIAHTIKGRGVNFMEDKTSWHYKNLDKKLYEEAISQNSN